MNRLGVFFVGIAIIFFCNGCGKSHSSVAVATNTSMSISTTVTSEVFGSSTTVGPTSTSTTMLSQSSCGDVQLGSNGSIDTIRVQGGATCDVAKQLASNSAVVSSQMSFDADGFHCASASQTSDPDQLYQCTQAGEQVTFDAHISE